MDISRFKRNPEAVRAAWFTDESSNKIIAMKACKVYFPKTWMTGRLGSIDHRFNVVGLFAVTVGNDLAVSDALSKMPLTPDSVNVVKVDGIAYYELSWEAGSTITNNRFLVKDNQILYHVFETFIGTGRVPWYMQVGDVSRLFITDEKHAAASLHTNQSIISVLVSAIARQEDRTKYHKELMLTQKDVESIIPKYISLSNISFSSTNTTARLSGGYLPDGMVSSLVNPSESNEKIEDMLLA